MPEQLPRRMRGGRALAIIAVAAAVILLLLVLASRWIEDRASAATDAAATNLAAGQAALLSSELQKFRLLPLVLGEYSDVAELLRDDDRAAAQRLNVKLELLAARTNAAAIYVIARNGRTIAASNWRSDTSFLGQNYGFRAYFVEAMRYGAAELFALGTVSHRPGLYLARRVDRDAGVIVVKVEFDRVEAAWRQSRGITIVPDKTGTILITSDPVLRFRNLHRQMRLQRGAASVVPSSAIWGDGNALTILQPIDRRDDQIQGTAPVNIGGGTLIHSEPIAPQLAAAQSSARVVVLLVIGTAMAIGTLVFRARDKRRMSKAAHDALEAAVETRTDELRMEARAREALDLRYRQAREELAHANRLAILGQLTAGVAHELNQPIAATRTYAQNAATLLQRDRRENVAENLDRIVGLADRMGDITRDLRSLARKGAPNVERLPVATAIDGACLILADRLLSVHVQRTGLDQNPEICVRGAQIRVEQVLINLLQNALDAVSGMERPHVLIAVCAEDEQVRIMVADNGPGIGDHVRQTLFDPFVTTKSKGLGLGLGISAAIALESGGSLTVVPSPLGGAAFVMTLRKA